MKKLSIRPISLVLLVHQVFHFRPISFFPTTTVLYYTTIVASLHEVQPEFTSVLSDRLRSVRAPPPVTCSG